MGRWIGYILLSVIAGMLLGLIHLGLALFVGVSVIAGTLFYIVYLLKKEQPRIIEDRLRKHFIHVQKTIQAGENQIDASSQEKEARTAES